MLSVTGLGIVAAQCKTEKLKRIQPVIGTQFKKLLSAIVWRSISTHGMGNSCTQGAILELLSLLA